jgi:ankyrin repeat protein
MHNRKILFNYITKGDLYGVKQVLEDNLDLMEEKTNDDQTILYIATAHNHKHIVKYLLEKKASGINNQHQGKTLLYMAAEKGYSDMVSLLINEGAITTIPSNNYESLQAIHIAAINGHLSTVKALLENKPNLTAFRDNLLPTVRVLLEATPDLLEQTDRFGNTPLHLASANGHKEVVEYLIQYGANVNTRSNDPDNHYYPHNGRTPLAFAAEEGHSDIVSLLINGGAIPTIPSNDQDFQAIHLTTMKGHLSTLKILIESDPSLLEQADRYGQTPLLWASAKGHTDIVAYLLQCGANIHVATETINVPYSENDHGKTPMNWALKHQHAGVIDVFVRHFLMSDIATSIAQPQLNRIFLKTLLPKKNGFINNVNNIYYNNQLACSHSRVLGETQNEIIFLLRVYCYLEKSLLLPLATIVLEYYTQPTLLNYITQFPRSAETTEKLLSNISSKKILLILNNPSDLKITAKDKTSSSPHKKFSLPSLSKFIKPKEEEKKNFSLHWFKKKDLASSVNTEAKSMKSDNTDNSSTCKNEKNTQVTPTHGI